MTYPNQHIERGADCAVRQYASSQVLSSLQATAERLDNFTALLENRLESVSTPSSPATAVNKLGTASPNFPPYFGELAHVNQRLSETIRQLEDILDRLEL